MPLSITWSLKGDTVSSDPVLSTTMIGQQTSLLSLSSVDYQHSGVYTCRAENMAGVSSHSAELLVNGNHQALEMFYLQRSRRSFHSPLGKMLSIRENSPNLLAWFLKEIILSPSPGVWRETSCPLTPPWPPLCSAPRLASSWYPPLTINTLGFTLAELIMRLESLLILLNF